MTVAAKNCLLLVATCAGLYLGYMLIARNAFTLLFLLPLMICACWLHCGLFLLPNQKPWISVSLIGGVVLSALYSSAIALQFTSSAH